MHCLMLIMFKEFKEKQHKEKSLSIIVQVDYGTLAYILGHIVFVWVKPAHLHTDLLGWPSIPY